MFVAILETGEPRCRQTDQGDAIAIAADAAFDAVVGAGPGASLTFVGVGGDLVLRVPTGSRVREGGFSLLGARQIPVAAGDGPEIQVKVQTWWAVAELDSLLHRPAI